MTFPTKETALNALEQSRAAYLAQARSIAYRIGQHGTPVTVDDVRRECPPPAGIDPRVMGAIFRKREWEKIGPVNSTRRTCHKRPIAQFILKEASE